MSTTTIEEIGIQAERHPPAIVRLARLAYVLGAGLFVAGGVLQVFVAGLGVLASPDYWGLHRAFGSLIGLIPFILLVLGLLGRLPLRLIGLTVLLIALFALQYVFLYAPLRVGVMELRALHAVNAFALVGTAMSLARGGTRLLRAPGTRR